MIRAKSLFSVVALLAFSVATLAPVSAVPSKRKSIAGKKIQTLATPQSYILGKMRTDLRDDPVKPSPKLALKSISIADVDGDKITDYQVNWEKLQSASWCGTGGCRYQLWRGREDATPQLIFDRYMRSVDVRRENGEVIYDFDFHGSACGGFGAQACPASFTWDAKLGMMVERVTPNGDGTVRYIDTLPNRKLAFPANIIAKTNERKNHCTSLGMKFDNDTSAEFNPTSVPDVDGDGLRDWMFGGNTCLGKDENTSEQLPDLLMVTAGNANAPAIALTDNNFEISIASNPARVSTIQSTEECQNYAPDPEQKPCPRIPLRWDAATKTFLGN
jgi:hypothetical protein